MGKARMSPERPRYVAGLYIFCDAGSPASRALMTAADDDATILCSILEALLSMRATSQAKRCGEQVRYTRRIAFIMLPLLDRMRAKEEG
jgi:hypothetical protein